MPEMDMGHMAYLDKVKDFDVRTLRHKEATYKGSWKRRGGIGAFMMLARKWDRLEGMAEASGYDIMAMLRKDLTGADGSPLAEVRDLRQYLTLVEAQIEHETNGFANEHVKVVVQTGRMDVDPLHQYRNKPGTPNDGGHHASDYPMDKQELVRKLGDLCDDIRKSGFTKHADLLDQTICELKGAVKL